jgi:carboxyl-terminal processing protease
VQHRKPARALRTLALMAVSALTPLALGAFILAHRGGSDLLDQVFSIVATRAVDSLPLDSIYVKAARGLVDNLDDPYAELYSPKELADFMRNSIGNSYGGLGMAIGLEDGHIVVTDVFPGAPAAKGGVERGDRIVAVNDTSTDGWSTEKVSQTLTGTPGTSVQVSFGQVDVAQPVTKTFVRAVVHAAAVPYTLLIHDSVGYVPLQRFNNTAAAEVDRAITTLRAEGATRFVLDLRGNGGGNVDQAVEIANLFLKQGMEVATQRERGAPNRVYVAKAPPAFPDEPLAVLIDQNTASASEIVTGALQDHDRAVVLGTRSFGKGLVQAVYNLDGGYALKLTTGKWYTPSGRSIHRDRRLVNGQLVLVDSADDSAAAVGMTTRSDAGRVLRAHGGITPDVTVAATPLTSGERSFFRAIAPMGSAFRDAIFDLARDQHGHVPANFTVGAPLRDSLWQRLTAAGATTSRATYDSAETVVDRLLTRQTLQLAYGDSAAVARFVPDDAVLARAVTLLEEARTEPEMFARIGE